MNESKLVLEYSNHLTLQQCMQRIAENSSGFVIIAEQDSTVVGILTDGDIRRLLLAGHSLNGDVGPYINRNFKYVEKGSRRENILKIFDHQIRFVPVLKNGKLTDVITQSDIEYAEKECLVAKAKAPARISFGGGGTDMTSFFMEHGGAVLNATIGLYAHASLRLRNDRKARIISHDFNETVEADGWEKLEYDGTLNLLKSAVRLLRPNFGFDLEVMSDFPPGSGLGGSSVVLSAVIGCFNEFRRHRLTKHDIAELAFQAERIELGLSGGWQDQYAAVFGGFNFMEFRSNTNEINSLRLAPEIVSELEERLVLCHTGQPHPHDQIHKEQKKRMVSDPDIKKMADRVREIAHEMKSSLTRGHLDALGHILHEAWTLKRTLAGGISDPNLDEIYEFARANGAVAGKILGAGGGGYFLFQASIDSQAHLIAALRKRGLEPARFTFENAGLRSWTIYDDRDLITPFKS